MPRNDELPDDLKALAHLNALQFSDANFDADYLGSLLVEGDNLLAQQGRVSNLLAQQGRLKEAAEAYREALRIDPQSASAHLDLGNLLEQQGRVQEGTEAYSSHTFRGNKPNRAPLAIRLSYSVPQTDFSSPRWTEATSSFHSA